MSGDGGTDPVTDFVNTLTEDPTNTLVNWATWGTLGYDSKKGGFTKGVVVNGLDETIGEMSGRNMARKAQMDAKDAIAEEKAQAATDLKNQRLKKQQADINASKTAGSLNTISRVKSKISLGSQEQDFLGL